MIAFLCIFLSALDDSNLEQTIKRLVDQIEYLEKVISEIEEGLYQTTVPIKVEPRVIHPAIRPLIYDKRYYANKLVAGGTSMPSKYGTIRTNDILFGPRYLPQYYRDYQEVM